MSQQPGGGNEEQKEGVWDRYQYTKIYNALKDLEEYNVKISVPEFVFIGFQSSGKTSAVSQAAKLAVGVMKHGTASRCPTRFKLINNPAAERPIIKVNGETCRDETDLTNKTLLITKKYEDSDIFAKDIIEVRIESAQVPELTFVDLPGLIKGDNQQFALAKRQLDELSAWFIHEQNPDGSYRYMPILVREPVDVEHDTHHEVTYIDNLVEKYGHGRKKRMDWRSDTLFIVNKFDKQINRSPASSLIEYMKYCSEYGQTVLTIMNAKGHNTANMSQQQLNAFVLQVEKDEEEKWNQVISEFSMRDDENLQELRLLKSDISGVAKMNEILAEKMCEIVKKILPFVERQLELAETSKRNEIAGIMKQIDMCDPQKLKGQCITFNNKFLKYLREYYNGALVLKIDRKYKKSWSKEMDDFLRYLHSTGASNTTKWKYEIPPGKLQTLLSKLSSKDKPAELLSLLKMDLLASAAINRMIDAWICMVAYMSFPHYTDEDIVNISGGFDQTRQPELWMSIRNLILDSVGHISDAAKYLGEMFRYKLKENADIIFEYTLIQEFGSTDLGSNAIIKLLQRTLRDYKLEIDCIINEFISVAQVVPSDQARILDKNYCEETINIGKLVYKLLNPQNKHKHKAIQRQRPRPYKASQTHVPPPPSGNQPPPPKGVPPPSGPAPPKGQPNLKQSSTQRKKTIQREEVKESKEDSKMQDQYEAAYNLQKYDQLFYEAIHGQKLNHPISFGSTAYDIALIRHLGYTFWTNIKHITTRDIVQKVTNLVMAPINQHDDRVSNAIQCGVDGRQVQILVNKLVDKTGVDVLALEKLIKTKSSIKIPKAINDLDNEELEEIYGINRETLLKVKEKRVQQLKDFKKLKAKTLIKIYHIKNGSVDELEGKHGNDDDEKLDIDDEDEYDIYQNARPQSNKGNAANRTVGHEDNVVPNDDDNYYNK